MKLTPGNKLVAISFIMTGGVVAVSSVVEQLHNRAYISLAFIASIAACFAVGWYSRGSLDRIEREEHRSANFPQSKTVSGMSPKALRRYRMRAMIALFVFCGLGLAYCVWLLLRLRDYSGLALVTSTGAAYMVGWHLRGYFDRRRSETVRHHKTAG